MRCEMWLGVVLVLVLRIVVLVLHRGRSHRGVGLCGGVARAGLTV